MNPVVRLGLAQPKVQGVHGLQGICLLIDEDKKQLVFHLGQEAFWRHRPTSVGVLCLARFCPEDNKQYRPRQTLATHAETPRGSGQSRRESLVVCLSK